MEGKAEGTSEGHDIAGEDGKIALNAEKIKSAYGKSDAQPDNGVDLLFKEETANGNENDVESGDKACLVA